MKATRFFALALAGLALAWGGVSCSSDDDPKVEEGKTTLSTPAPQATDITASSFVATWPAVTGAGSYVYTVNNGAEKSVNATSVKVEGLTANTAYTFKVKAVPSNTADFEESAWGSANVTTKEAPQVDDMEYTMSISEAEFEYYGEGAWTNSGVPVDAHNFVIDFFDYVNMAILEIELQTATASIEGTFPVSDTLEAGTAVTGVVLGDNMYGSWYLPFISDGTALEWDRVAQLIEGSIQIKKNADGTYDVNAELAGYHNLIEAETDDEVGVTVVHATFSGEILEAAAAESASVKRVVKPTNYRKFAFADVNRVAGSFTNNVR